MTNDLLIKKITETIKQVPTFYLTCEDAGCSETFENIIAKDIAVAVLGCVWDFLINPEFTSST